MSDKELKVQLQLKFNQGIEHGIKLMEQRMILAAENGNPIEINGRAYFVKDDMRNLREIIEELEGMDIIMVDITKLNVGEVFYRLMWYEAVYKMEVVKKYNIEKNLLLAKYIEGDTPHIGKAEWIEPDEDEKYFLACDEAERAYLKAQEKRLEYLSDINNLLDELYSEFDGDKSNSVRLYGEAIKRVKKKFN